MLARALDCYPSDLLAEQDRRPEGEPKPAYRPKQGRPEIDWREMGTFIREAVAVGLDQGGLEDPAFAFTVAEHVEWLYENARALEDFQNPEDFEKAVGADVEKIISFSRFKKTQRPA